MNYMNKITCGTLWVLSTIGMLFGSAGVSAPADFNAYFINAASQVKNSVVSIAIYEKNNGGGRSNYSKIAYGSGTIIDDGYIITNYHVIMKGDYYQVQYNDGALLELERFENGSYYLADPKTDIALIRVRHANRLPLSPVVFDDSNDLSEGEWVLAIGNPYGLRQTITTGIVSSKGRDNIGFADIEDFIQTDVPINPGNSGGPLVNLKGKLVGVNTAIRSESGGYQGISFAIPSNLVKQVCRELINHGRVRRGWIGFLVKEKKISPEQEKSYLKIISVIKNSPAESAGLQIGDIIRDIDGQQVYTLGGLIKSVGNKPVGTKIQLSVSRDGRLKKCALMLRERKVYKKIRTGMNRLFTIYGIEIDENSASDDLIISYISPKSIVYNLKKGDVVKSLNGRQVTSLDAFVKVFDRNGYRINTLRINRDSKILDINFSE